MIYKAQITTKKQQQQFTVIVYFLDPPPNSNRVYPPETFFQICDFLLVFLIYRVKPLIIFSPQNDPLKLKAPNSSGNFEMSLRGGGLETTQIR